MPRVGCGLGGLWPRDSTGSFSSADGVTRIQGLVSLGHCGPSGFFKRIWNCRTLFETSWFFKIFTTFKITKTPCRPRKLFLQLSILEGLGLFSSSILCWTTTVSAACPLASSWGPLTSPWGPLALPWGPPELKCQSKWLSSDPHLLSCFCVERPVVVTQCWLKLPFKPWAWPLKIREQQTVAWVAGHLDCLLDC